MTEPIISQFTNDARTHEIAYHSPEINCFAVFVVRFHTMSVPMSYFAFLRFYLLWYACYLIMRTIPVSQHMRITPSIHCQCNRPHQ